MCSNVSNELLKVGALKIFSASSFPSLASDYKAQHCNNMFCKFQYY